jgi:Rieske Fe-S protein
MSETTRRGLLAGAAGVGAAAVLAACGNDSSNTGSGGSDAGSGAQAGSTPTAGQEQGGQTGGGSGIKTSDIPVGGGKVFKEQNVVVTQPTAGQFRAFSATCTHQGCPVGSVENGVIICPCHQSKFSAADGSVKSGPAKAPLPAKNVTVSGGNLTIA